MRRNGEIWGKYEKLLSNNKCGENYKNLPSDLIRESILILENDKNFL